MSDGTPKPSFHRVRHRGLTLVELLVAVGILALILSFAGVIFAEVTDAIRTGLATSDVTATNRSIGDQLKRDFKHMIPPGDEHPRGFLVIVNDQVSGRRALDQNGYEVNYGRIESDSIGFLVRYPESHPLHSMTAESGRNHYRSSLSSPDARIWYGHVTPMDTPGLPTMVNDIPLGRQALLLAGSGKPTSGSTLADQLAGATRDYADMRLRKLTGYNADDPIQAEIPPNADAQAYTDRMFIPPQRLRVRTQWEKTSPKEISRLHPLLASGCSDFNIQVATEIGNDGTPNWPADPSQVLPSGASAPMSRTVNGRTAYIWPHDNTSNWPKLIRIQYRLHDERGRLRSTPPDGGRAQPGQWYEHVRRVPQP